jgi:4-amino-4-deoxy-L-arabinose transferase-like glycosyltransferase
MPILNQRAKTSDIWKWWLPLLAICTAAAIVRLTHIDHDLPSNADPDAQIQFLWARAFRETGRPNVQRGSGYPPGALSLLAAEQIVLEIVRGQDINPSMDYYLTARVINAWLGVASVALAAELAHRIGKSALAGLAVAMMTALVDLTVIQSRRGNPDSPWVFFTLLAFYFLLFAHQKKSLLFFYLSFFTGIISLLFKYHSGVFLLLPFIFIVIDFRHLGKKLLLHLGLFSLISLSLVYWLIFDYQILQIVEDPFSPTGSAFRSGGIAGFQSFSVQWVYFAQALTGDQFLWGIVGAIILALVSLFSKSLREHLEVVPMLGIGFYLAAFYLLLSLFKPSLLTYWLAAVVPAYIIVFAGLFAFLNAFKDFLVAQLGRRWGQFAQAIIVSGSLIYGGIFIQERWLHWLEVYQSVWSRPYTLNVVAQWFGQNVPQGGRMTSEVIKLPFVYIYPPRAFHMNSVGSLFDETIQDYSERGYEYLIWTNLKSDRLTDNLSDLDAPERKTYLQQAQELLRITGNRYWGPDVVVYKLPLLQKHPLYLWFTPAISFRGYDLNKESFKPGDDLELMFYWMSAERVQANYIVFVHIISAETGELLVGKDEPTDNGYHPTFTWGGDMQFIRDRHTLTIPANANTGKYIVRFGMYDADTQVRVKVTTPKNEPVGDLVVLQEIRIEK